MNAKNFPVQQILIFSALFKILEFSVFLSYFDRMDSPFIFTPLHILVVTKMHNANALKLAKDISVWLLSLGHEVFLPKNIADIQNVKPKGIHLGIVLGGDGTMLGVARQFVDKPIPLVGINFGRVGFLAELESDNWQKGLAALLGGRHSLVKRMALGWQVYRDNALIYGGYAINDAVLNRGAMSRVISLDVSVHTELIGRLRADGLIVSSPVGSTGYAVSAGGPLVHPANNTLLVTAICPYLCNFPAMVLPHTMPVRITLNQSSTETFLTIDGQESYPLVTHDIIEIFSIPDAVHFIRLENDRYFTPLRERGFIQGLE